MLKYVWSAFKSVGLDVLQWAVLVIGFCGAAFGLLALISLLEWYSIFLIPTAVFIYEVIKKAISEYHCDMNRAVNDLNGFYHHIHGEYCVARREDDWEDRTAWCKDPEVRANFQAMFIAFEKDEKELRERFPKVVTDDYYIDTMKIYDNLHDAIMEMFKEATG